MKKLIYKKHSFLFVLASITLLSVLIASGTFTFVTVKNSIFAKPTQTPVIIPTITPTITPSTTPSPTSIPLPTYQPVTYQSNPTSTQESCVVFTNLKTGEKKCIYRSEIAQYGISPLQFEKKRLNPNYVPTSCTSQIVGNSVFTKCN